MLDFDPERAPTKPRDAATVILLRPGVSSGTAEVFLLRRHRGASFMAQAFVFPGGGREGDEDLRATAARELFEEAGVLLAVPELNPAELPALRARVAAGESLEKLLLERGSKLDLERLVPFAHWITPSAEKKRFSARFFVTTLPPGQTPSFDAKETVDQVWVTPEGALARSDDLRLPPPQLRTLREISAASRRGPDAVIALARSREPHIKVTIPRFALVPTAPSGFALLLPWDTEYETLGKGEGEVWPAGHPLAEGPSRFVLEGTSWKHVSRDAS